MNITLTLKLLPTIEQRSALLATMERVNAACNAIAGAAFEMRTANKIVLQKALYGRIRAEFELSSQMACLAIHRTAEAYKRDKKKLCRFDPHGAVPFDRRVYAFKGADRLSILTLQGRILVPIVFGRYQRDRLVRLRGQADLIYRDGLFYLAVVVDVPEPPQGEPTDWLGVDLGIANIATDSDGEAHAGGKLNGLRHRHARLRAKLQAKGTKSARRLLKQRRHKESRFARDVNHCLSKRLVAKAKGTGRGIALEDLSGIRERTTVKKAQRRIHHSWAFHQLRSFVQYKARLAGVPVVLVDPRNTSRACPECGAIDKRNRPTRDTFCCVSCGHAGPADHIAAVNIRGRAARHAATRGAILHPQAPSFRAGAL